MNETNVMVDALATVDQLRIDNDRLRNIVAGYTDGISAGRESKQSYEKNDEKHGVADTNRASLTDAEREAIERAAFALNGGEDWSPDVGTKDKQACVTLRSLLERMR